MLAVLAGLSMAGSSLLLVLLAGLSCVFGPQLGGKGQQGPLSMGSHILEEAIPSLLTWWQKVSQQLEKTYCPNMQALFQFLLVAYFPVSPWPQQALRPSQDHWRCPSVGVDTGRCGGA